MTEHNKEALVDPSLQEVTVVAQQLNTSMTTGLSQGGSRATAGAVRAK